MEVVQKDAMLLYKAFHSFSVECLSKLEFYYRNLTMSHSDDVLSLIRRP